MWHLRFIRGRNGGMVMPSLSWVSNLNRVVGGGWAVGSDYHQFVGPVLVAAWDAFAWNFAEWAKVCI
jgi:hypothetical protein